MEGGARFVRIISRNESALKSGYMKNNGGPYISRGVPKSQSRLFFLITNYLKKEYSNSVVIASLGKFVANNRM